MRRIRFQIGIRLMLLLVALVAVLFAWIGVEKEKQRIKANADLDEKEYLRRYLISAPSVPGMEATHRARIEEVEAEIAERRKRLGIAPTK